MSSMQHDHNFTSKACMHAYNPMNNSVESRSKKLIFTISTEHLETNSGLYTVVKAYIGFSHEFVPIMFQKNEKKIARKPFDYHISWK